MNEKKDNKVSDASGENETLQITHQDDGIALAPGKTETNSCFNGDQLELEEVMDTMEKESLEKILDTLRIKLDELKRQYESIEAEFKSKIKYDQHKEKIIDNLHRELQEYKNDWIRNLLRPLIIDIIHTIDDVTKLAANHKSKDISELDPLKLIKQMEGISSDLEDILQRQGVEPFNCNQQEFNPKRQKIINTESIGDKSKDKTISRSIYNGYEWEGKVIRQEGVNIYVYKPDSNEPELNQNKEKKS